MVLSHLTWAIVTQSSPGSVIPPYIMYNFFKTLLQIFPASHLCWSHWTSSPLNRKFNLKFSDSSLHGESHAYISELLLQYAISRTLRCSDPKIQNIFTLWPSVWDLTFSNSDLCSILFCFCLISPVFFSVLVSFKYWSYVCEAPCDFYTERIQIDIFLLMK